MYDVDRMPARISIGRETESGVTDVRVSCESWLKKWPGMKLTALHRPQGHEPYILRTEMVGSELVWTVSDADTAVPGAGKLEIYGEVDGKRKVSAMADVLVAGRMGGVAGPAPEPERPWVERAEGAADRAEDALQELRDKIASGEFKGDPGEPGKDAVVDDTLTQHGQAADAKATGDALAGKLTEPSSGLAVGKYFRIAAIDENGHAVLEAVDAPVGGLSTEPSLWPAWTSDEQKAARERLGEFTDSALTTVADVTMDEDANILNAQLAKPCRFVACTFIIPPEDTGKNRNIYFATNLDGGASVTKMFTRSAQVSTSATMSAFYLASALIVGGKILSFGCIASTGTNILDHQTRELHNPPNGYCVMTADNFESISVFTYGDAFPAGSQLVVTGC